MKWNKLTIETTTAAEDMLSYELSEMGMEGVEIEDHVMERLVFPAMWMKRKIYSL